MKNIAMKLIDYGFDFQYENHNSNGEKIIVIDLDIEISTNNSDYIHFISNNQQEAFKNEPRSFDYLVGRVEKLLIEATN